MARFSAETASQKLKVHIISGEIRAEKDSHKSASKGKESRIGATKLTQPDPALKWGTA